MVEAAGAETVVHHFFPNNISRLVLGWPAIGQQLSYVSLSFKSGTAVKVNFLPVLCISNKSILCKPIRSALAVW